MTILVAGCAGFIGWKVSEQLLNEGEQVIGIDDLNDHYSPELKYWRLDQLMKYKNFIFKKLNIANRNEMIFVLENLIKNARKGIDAVINLAARPGVRQSINDPFTYFQTNVIGALNLIEWACRNGIPRYLLASSSSVYGNDCPRPFKEEFNTDKPISPYASSKKAAETLCYSYHYIYGIDVTILRYFTVYGPAGRPDMAMFRFVRWVAEDEVIKIYGNGEQERDFTYVQDIASGTIKALMLSGFNIINLGSDRPVTINKVLQIISSELQKQPRIKYEPPQKLDVQATWADITRAKRLLSWKPETDISDGIKATIEWYKRNREWAKNISI